MISVETKNYNGVINPCIELCERSSCCRDMFFQYLNKKQLRKLIPEDTHAVQFNSADDIPYKKDLKFMRRGVYYAKSGKSGYYTATIAGPCPNLGENGECTIYKQRPTPCRKYKSKSEDCNKVRHRDGLAPIQELIQLLPRIKGELSTSS